MSESVSQKVKFLWKAAQTYSVACPELASHLTERFSVVSSKAAPTSCHAFYCPCCCSMFTPDNSRTRIMGAGLLRMKRRRTHVKFRAIPWLSTSSVQRQHGKYLVVHCKVCKQTFVSCGLSKSQSKMFQTPRTNSRNKLLERRGSSSYRQNLKRKNSSLKRMLTQHSQWNRTPVGSSPRLQDFLTSLQ